MSEQTQTGLARQGRDKAEMVFVPFGGTDPITLTLNVIKNYVAVPTKSGKTCTDRDAMKFMMLCQAQRLNPFAGDAFLVGFDKWDKKNNAPGAPQFNLITAHQAFLKRAETSNDYEGMESGIIILKDKDGTETIEREGDFVLPNEIAVGGWAKVYRKGRKVTYRRLAIAAMMPNYETPFWNEQKAPGQIVKCAEADALRATFPTLLGGLYHGGEIIDISATREPVQIPQGQLVDVIPAVRQNESGEQGEETEQEPPGKKAEPSGASKAELEKLITEAGFTFNHFQVWAKETGQIENADSLPSFEEVPEAVAKRLVRAKAGLLKALADVKGAEA